MLTYQIGHSRAHYNTWVDDSKPAAGDWDIHRQGVVEQHWGVVAVVLCFVVYDLKSKHLLDPVEHLARVHPKHRH